MNRLRSTLVIAAVLALGLALVASQVLAVQVGNDEVQFLGVRYDDPQTGQSTWFYAVTSGAQPNISHVTFQLGDCLTVVEAGTWDGPSNFDSRDDGGVAYELGTDPTTGVTGIKFDEPIPAGETRYYYFTVDGNYAEGQITVATKAGSGFDSALVTGPNLDCEGVLILGDEVWYDIDRDGIQDDDEPGVEDIDVALYDSDDCSGTAIDTDVTDAVGKYLFTGLAPGTYCIEFSDIPADWVITLPDQGGDDTVDSDADQGTAQITNITLTTDDLTQDMGLYRPGEIGDTVWCDGVGGNGQYDAGEGIPDVTVNLYSDPNCDGDEADGEVIRTTQTSGDGQYLFSDLLTGPPDCGQKVCYVVKVDRTDPDLGACNIPFTDVEYATSLCAIQFSDRDADFGFLELVLGEEDDDFDYGDAPDSTNNAPGSPSMSDQYGLGTGNFPTTISNTTQSNGLLGFCHVLSDTGSYLGMAVSTESNDADLPPDSDPTTNISPTLDLPDQDLADDAIEQPLTLENCTPISVPVQVTVGENLGEGTLWLNLWFDWNRDGDWGTSAGGDVSTCTVTDDTPEWAVQDHPITGLAPGMHTISVTVTPWNPSPTNTLPIWTRVTLSQYPVDAVLGGYSGGYLREEVDFCFDDGETEDHLLQPELFILGDRVWYDTDRDGIQHPLETTEPGVEGIVVELYGNGDCTGGPIASDTTDAVGNYLFTDLAAGTYCIEFSNIPAGWEITDPNQGGDDALDSDADQGTARITNIDLGADDLTQDMGLYRPGEIGDRVWCDDGDGVYEDGEGLNDITVTLYTDPNCNGDESDYDKMWTTVTADGLSYPGYYLFDDLLTGPPDCGQNVCYVVKVDANDDDLGTCNLPITPIEDATSLCATQPTYYDADFGFQEPITICGFVYDDLNGNGVLDPGEPPIPDVLITLQDDEGNVVAQTVTDDNGGYCFYGYPPGVYVVIETDPEDYASTNSLPGTGGSQEDENTIRVEATTPGETYETQDFLDTSTLVGGATLPTRGVRLFVWAALTALLGLLVVASAAWSQSRASEAA